MINKVVNQFIHVLQILRTKLSSTQNIKRTKKLSKETWLNIQHYYMQ